MIIIDFLKRLFGFGETNEAKIRRLARAAGILVAQNNPSYCVLARTAFNNISNTITEAYSFDSVKHLLQSALRSLLLNARDSKSHTAIMLVLNELDIDGAVSTIPQLSSEMLSSLVTGFIEGFGCE